MPVSDNFTKLKNKVDSADRDIREAAARDTAELKAMVDQARRNADARAAELHAKAGETADQAERQWNEVQGDWDRHIKRIRGRIEAKKAAHEVDVAERDAEWAELDALDAIDFAYSAVEEAEYAVLDAVLARKDADVMAAAV